MLACAVLLVGGAATAKAFFADGAQIVSASFERLEQADDLTLAVDIAGDGRFVLVQTRARNLYADGDADPSGEYRVGGIFRFDRQTGALHLVANGDRRRRSDDALLYRGAQNGSTSRDGRYVVFATGEPLVPTDTNDNVDIYVRDMTVARGAPGAFDLVSARDGGDVPARYAPPPEEQDFPGRNPGADVSPRAAISSDGRRVAFRTTAASDLPARIEPDAGAFQVFVRDRTADTTRLVTRDKDSGDPAGGALGPAGISGDGTTVVWTGRNAPAQTRFLDGEGQNPATEQYLWQRIAEGAGAPTRRITGFVDPDDPACPPDAVVEESVTATGPCYGPLAPGAPPGGLLGQLPALSEDGYRVAFLHDANPRGAQGGGTGLDLYLTSMRPGVSRKAGTVELTREGTGTLAVNAGIDGLAMSGDGRWAVLATARTTFVLPALRQLTAPRADATVRELYLVDLQDRTIERMLHGYAGDDANGAVGPGPAVDDAARQIAFTSGATNLFYGDANGQVDGFVVTRLDAPPETAPEPPPEEPAPEPLPPLVGETEPPRAGRLEARVLRAMRSGEVRIEVRAPRRGDLEAVARGRLPAADGKRAGRARTLARSERAVRRAGRLVLRLRLGSRNRRRLARVRRIEAQTQVTFQGVDGRDYARRLGVVFVHRARAARRRAPRQG